MKKLILLILILSAGSLKAQSYYPMLDTTAYWNEIELHQGTCDPPEYCKATYYLRGDTIIDAYTYKKLYSTGGNSITYIGGLREENQQVYLYYTFCDHSVLLYDYNLTVGDSITKTCLLAMCDSSENINMTVTSIDSVLLDDQTYRKRINFNDGSDMSWIEGIGSASGLLYPYYSCVLCVCFRELVCYQVNGSTLYHNEEDVPCFNYYVSIYESEKKEELSQIFPNPVGYNSFVMINSSEDINSIQLFDITGRMISFQENLNVKAIPFQLGSLRKGIYILHISYRNRISECNKLIIN